MKIVINIPEAVVQELPNWVIIPTKLYDVIVDSILNGMVLQSDVNKELIEMLSLIKNCSKPYTIIKDKNNVIIKGVSDESFSWVINKAIETLKDLDI